jgi:hypothetical protein
MAIVNLPDTLDPVKRRRLKTALARILARQVLEELRFESEAPPSITPTIVSD